MSAWAQVMAVFLLAAPWALLIAQQAPPAAPASAPAATVSGPEQPLPFSHKLHAGSLGLPCETCHTPSPSGAAFRIPQAPTCMQCHAAVATERPAIQKLAALAQSHTLIPWVRIYELPSFVTFSHKTHLDHGATCEQCHGAVRERDRLFKESDLSMKWCVDCHTVRRASNDCNACHTLDQ
jgi:hypothetical protein